MPFRIPALKSHKKQSVGMASYIQLQSNPSVISRFENTIKLYGLSSLDPFLVGLYFWGKGLQSVSIKFLEKAYSLDPSNPQIISALAKAHECNGSPAQAEIFYINGVSLKSKDLICDYGGFLQRHGRFSDLKNLIDSNPIGEFYYPWTETDLYSESFENNVWFDYLVHSRLSTPPPRDNTGIAFNLYNEVVRNHLTTDSVGLLDIGVFCPAVFEEIALTQGFEDLRFIGVDRSTNIQTKNLKQFKLAENIEYAKWKEDTNLPFEVDLKGFIAVHMRTATLMSAMQVTSLYKNLHESGVQKVIGIEFIGLSKYSRKFIDYDADSSEKLRYPMWVHPLPAIARSSGYSQSMVTYLPKPILLQDFGLGESMALSIIN